MEVLKKILLSEVSFFLTSVFIIKIFFRIQIYIFNSFLLHISIMIKLFWLSIIFWIYFCLVTHFNFINICSCIQSSIFGSFNLSKIICPQTKPGTLSSMNFESWSPALLQEARATESPGVRSHKISLNKVLSVSYRLLQNRLENVYHTHISVTSACFWNYY